MVSSKFINKKFFWNGKPLLLLIVILHGLSLRSSFPARFTHMGHCWVSLLRCKNNQILSDDSRLNFYARQVALTSALSAKRGRAQRDKALVSATRQGVLQAAIYHAAPAHRSLFKFKPVYLCVRARRAKSEHRSVLSIRTRARGNRQICWLRKILLGLQLPCARPQYGAQFCLKLRGANQRLAS
jgi:hypothetical protein